MKRTVTLNVVIKQFVPWIVPQDLNVKEPRQMCWCFVSEAGGSQNWRDRGPKTKHLRKSSSHSGRMRDSYCKLSGVT